MVETKRSIVEQIHHEFNTASDNALAEATAILSGVSNNSHLFTLHELGFKNAKGVQSYISSNGTINDYKRMCGIITSYQYQYPNYKFITESDVERICKKYKLGCSLYFSVGINHIYFTLPSFVSISAGFVNIVF